ncbi:MAG: xanthine dehydrogenase molybdopterin binding subunit [Acidovorax sp.]
MNRQELPAVGFPHPLASAHAQATGDTAYTGDLPEILGTLHAAPILSPVAHGRITRIDTAAALALDGVHGVVLARDVPHDAPDAPVFAHDLVQYAGQVIGLAVADTAAQARRAARQVQVHITPLPAVLTLQQALAEAHYALPPVFLRRGQPEAAIAQAPHRLTGQLETGAQEHFYLEGQTAYALPLEQGEWWVYASTQNPGEVQRRVAQALGLPAASVRVECASLGGGFGGKETQAAPLAVWAAVAAHRLGRPVKLGLLRGEDFRITGKRHPFACDWQVGFDGAGRILGLQLRMAADCGHSGADLSGPVADRAALNADGAYFLPHVAIASYRCKTHTQSHTAFRGLGAPQGAIVIETIVGDIARALGLDGLAVRRANLYGVQERNTTHYQMPVEDNILHDLLPKLELSARYQQRQQAILAWNAQHPALQRGLALTPVKFGISAPGATTAPAAGVRVHIHADGGVQVSHGGTDMGQGLHTKVAQLVADALGVPLARVRALPSDTLQPRSAGGSRAAQQAAQSAARQVRARLAAFVAELDGCGAKDVRIHAGQVVTPRALRTWDEAVQAAHAHRVPLWSDGGGPGTPPAPYGQATPAGHPFCGFAYGAACAEVALDTLTGECRVLAVDVLHDVGHSINPAIDIGQIEGGLVQGLGWLTTEQLVWNASGQLATQGADSYKIPATGDVPQRLSIQLWPRGQDRAHDSRHLCKSVGEPPFLLAISVYEALRNAVASARADGQPVHLNVPATAERLLRALGRLEDRL